MGAFTNLLYSGEIFDQRIAMQYLRARYYNPASGTFNRLDPFAGNMQDPLSLHKYLYVHGDPANGIDPSGLEFSMTGLMSSMAITGTIGGMIGGIDAYLGGENAWGIAAGVAVGFGFGAIAGAFVYALPGMMVSSFVFGLNLGFSLPFIADSFNRGKNAQGFFRIFTGIFVPIALRNAAIARLASASANAAATRIATLWRQIPLRTNILAGDGWSATYLSRRIPLSSDVQPGKYIYVVDRKGKMWLGPADDSIKHSSLLPKGGKARTAGEIVIRGDRTVDGNSSSGHFMMADPILPDGAEEASWLLAIASDQRGQDSLLGVQAMCDGVTPCPCTDFPRRSRTSQRDGRDSGAPVSEAMPGDAVAIATASVSGAAAT